VSYEKKEKSMSDREWKRTARDARKLEREAKVGDTYYSIEDHAQPWGDEPMWHPYVVTHISRWFGPMVSGAKSLKSVLAQCGPLYDEPPTTMRGYAEPAGQLFEPFGGGEAAHGRDLVEDAYPEVRRAREAAEKKVRDSRRRKPARR
jgi:hypothetical protein